MGQKCYAKRNYKIVIIMEFLLYRIIVSKMFLIDAPLNIGHSIES